MQRTIAVQPDISDIESTRTLFADAFLASESYEATWINGQVIQVNGGIL
ncbi:MAG: hypothetical protein KME11_11560 [Timaviella obliquedivisa GSE-PSE-MK23-08B]|nr:hypothetical protein [Timaviella obliquedivisa GSE-PSE-MK23-08B]